MSSASERLGSDQFRNRILDRNGKMGKDACEIMASIINAVNPYRSVIEHIRVNNSVLEIGNQKYHLNKVERIFLVGFGKASVPMAKAVVDQLGEKLSFAEVITKDPQYLLDDGYKNILCVHLGGHPVPSQASILNTQEILNRLPRLTQNDLVLVLVSGGGSALFTEPMKGIDLEDLRKLTKILLKCGANIYEINTLRKHLDQVKGGGLARKFQPAKVHSLIISDVIGDQLDMIASGPTIPDRTTFADALKIISKYELSNKIPSSILSTLQMGSKGEIPETLKAEENPSNRLSHTLVATNFIAAKAAHQIANRQGYNSLIITTQLRGLTENVADFLNGVIQTEILHSHPLHKPLCLIFGGETTVMVEGQGLGGRNQDLVLRLVERISGVPGLVLISLATDGEDGPTNAAGAVADGMVYQEGIETYGMNIHEFIQENDAYHYFERLGGLIKTGATGTNVNDFVLILME
jgi:hydroxypyruvate reductase